MPVPANYRSQAKVYSSMRYARRPYGHSVYFPGSENGFLTRSNDAALNFTALGKMTFMGWIQLANMNRVNMIYVKGQGGVKGFRIVLEMNAGKLCICFQNMKDFSSRRYTIPNLEKSFFHWALRFDGAVTARITEFLINGSPYVYRLTDMNFPTMVDDATSNPTVGSDYDQENFHGWQQELMFFNNRLLSKRDIINNYLYGKMPRDTMQHVIDPTFHLTMNENSGFVVPDHSPSGLNFNFANNAQWSDHTLAS